MTYVPKPQPSRSTREWALIIVACASCLVTGYVVGRGSGIELGREQGRELAKAGRPPVQIKCDCRDLFERSGVKCAPGCRCCEGVRKP